jgi:hypothetical protein
MEWDHVKVGILTLGVHLGGQAWWMEHTWACSCNPFTLSPKRVRTYVIHNATQEHILGFATSFYNSILVRKDIFD